MRKPDFPKLVRAGSVTVKVYRVAHKSSATGFAFTVAWHDFEGRPVRKQRSSLDEAMALAHEKASELGAGLVSAAEFTADDREELAAARSLLAGVPLVSAVKEWLAANELAPGQVLAACREWAERHRGVGFQPLAIADAVDAFIRAKDASGKQGERTYRAKLKPLAAAYGGRTLDSLTPQEWTAYLGRFTDPVTRNDHRKRAASLCHWARRFGYLPRLAPLAIEDTERADEPPTDIGILTPEQFGQLLDFFRAQHPEMLAAVALAGFTGIRQDELHGKRKGREVRQLWSDVHLDQGILRVTNAKTNTAAWRLVPLCEACIEWLRIAPRREDGFVCGPGDMEKARLLARAAGFVLPENCFRHSFITHRVALVEDKPKVALEAGNSVKELDRRYRVPIPKTRGEQWFALRPERAC